MSSTRFAKVIHKKKSSPRKQFYFFIPLSFFSLLLISFAVPAYSTTEVTLAWNLNTEPDIAGYKIYIGTTFMFYSRIIYVGNANYTITINDINCSEEQPCYFAVTAFNSSGFESPFSDQIHFPSIFNRPPPLNVGLGIFNSGIWYFSTGNNGIGDVCEIYECFGIFGGMSQDKPFVGDWDGTGMQRIAIYRDGDWFLDKNGNGKWSDCDIDGCITNIHKQWDNPTPIVGDWDGNGKTKFGLFKYGQWVLDLNGSGQWEGEDDKWVQEGEFGEKYGDVPVVGDWSGDGKSKIGVYRNGNWYLDYDGKRKWDGCDVDLCLENFFVPVGPGESNIDNIPIIGDWGGYGRSSIGIYRHGKWFLDFNSNGLWDGCEVDMCIEAFGGYPEDIPVVR